MIEVASCEHTQGGDMFVGRDQMQPHIDWCALPQVCVLARRSRWRSGRLLSVNVKVVLAGYTGLYGGPRLEMSMEPGWP
jgi:hypothetical protein